MDKEGSQLDYTIETSENQNDILDSTLNQAGTIGNNAKS